MDDITITVLQQQGEQWQQELDRFEVELAEAQAQVAALDEMIAFRKQAMAAVDADMGKV